MKRIVNAWGKLDWGAYAALGLCAMTAMTLPAQTFTTLHSFNSADGANPGAALVQATSGNFYGTATYGGANDGGTVFAINTRGTLTALHSFCSQSGCTDGQNPAGGLVQAANGDFYGTTSGYYLGGPDYWGTIFRMTPSGTLTTLYSFCSQNECADGATPSAGLVQATSGEFYGTTYYGGANFTGAVFKITPTGTLTTLYSFCSQGGHECTDGEYPTAGLVQATDGDFYGTTSCGGSGTPPDNNPRCSGAASGSGTVFKITSSGQLTTLYSFCSQIGCTDGEIPSAGLVQAANGDLYGTTSERGAGAGTVFKITPSGALTTLYRFCSQSACADGNGPSAGLVQATDGNLYGTTRFNGANGGGTGFEMTPNGTLTTLYSFCAQSGCTDGANPVAGLVQATNGDFYGTTPSGGANGDGTVFRLSVGLGPFVETRPTSGEAGRAVEILGTDLTGATSVTFNGTAAVFTINSSGTAISTTVPAGATSGAVQVITQSRTLSSNAPFRVLP